jgi:uncharacterized LabA/DUF88 family protein
MSSVAVFVDAGYLFAQGSTALTGSKKRREALRLNETAIMAELSSTAHAKSSNLPLLRVYWYDGARSGHALGLEHATLAYTDYIKLRLGMMNSVGQQKGVDSLIVTDLIELARNRAISDAVLLSGDEDVRIGVRIAQSFGVRVHLIGITPARGSQSPQLMQEADTTTEWDTTIVGRFLSVLPSPIGAVATPPAAPAVIVGPPIAASIPGRLDVATCASLDVACGSIHSALDSTDIGSLHAFWAVSRGLPQEVDGRLLSRCRFEIGRSLSMDEKRYARSKLTTLVRGGIASGVAAPVS